MSTQKEATSGEISAALPAMRAIQAFEAIARCGSAAAAADEMGVSPGAVSQQLRKIEKQLNVRLFEREGRSLALTAWGRIYYERVRSAFDELRRAQHLLQVARSKQSIVLSALPSTAIWLQHHLLEWRTTHPAISMRLIGTEREPSLQEECVDFRLCYGNSARSYDRYSELFVDAVVPVCSAGFLRTHPVTTPGDILASVLIDITWDARQRPPPTWADWAWSLGLNVPAGAAQLAYSLSGAAIDAALEGGGFVLGQMSMIGEHVRQGRLVVPIDRRLSMPEPYFLAWERDALDRPCCAEFRDMLIAAGRLQRDIVDGATSPASG